ncbi:MAG: hypothetical protein JNK14_19460 [Chitinophagaceae bacterium]|nr:hypothetical protein [Chitinophagaceae bacterium]
MRKVLPTLVLSFCIHTTFAQQDSLLRNFKFRNINYRAVTFDASGGGQFSSTDFPAGKSEGRSGSGSAGASYYIIKSTDGILLNAFASASTGFGSSRSDNSSDEYKNRNFYLAPVLTVNNKWFSKNLFTELGAEVSGNFYSSKNTSSAFSSENKSKQQAGSLAITAGIGKGRLENVTHMQNALWLHQTLEKEKRLTRSLSAEELNGLGQAIAVANNTRVLDARKRTQYILEAIDTYFQKKGLISTTDIRYFSSLNDIVFFAFNDARLAGTELFIRATPAIMHYDYDLTQQPASLKTEENAVNRSVRLSAGINKHVPVSLKHQNNFGAALQLYYLSNDYTEKFFSGSVQTGETRLDPVLKQAGASAFFEHAIYPNTRTIIRFKLDTETGYQDIGNENSFFNLSNLSGFWNYFISYRTRLNCGLGVSYRKNIYALNSYLTLLPESIQLFANAGVQVSL